MCKPWIALGASLLLVTGTAAAANHQGLYVGAGLGDFSAKLERNDTVSTTNISFDRNTSASKVFAGWRFTRFFALEGDYVDFGKSKAAVETLGITAKTTGFAPYVVGTLPIGPVELFAKGGVLYYDLKVNGPSGRLVDASSHDAVYGAGIGFVVLQRLSLRAEYEQIDVSQFASSHSVWLTAAWRF